MQSRSALYVLLISLLTVALPATAPAAYTRRAADPPQLHYNLVSLGTLGGTNSGAISINNRSWITGFSLLAGNATQNAALWLHGATIGLGTLGGPNSAVEWPNHNNQGLVVGITETAALNPFSEPFSCLFGTGHVCQGFVWNDNVMTALPTLGGYDSYATDINDWGQIVGWAENTVHDPTCVLPQVFQFEAVIWEPGLHRMQQLAPYPGDSDTAATAINDSGQAVGISGVCDIAYGGTSAKNPVLWQNGNVIRLGTLGGIMFNTPAAINQLGQIVGWSDFPGDTSPATQVFHAVLWAKNGSLVDLGTLPGDKYSLAYAINDFGQVVGQSIDADGNSRAFLWQNGSMIDLNTLVSSGSPALVYANDINDFGELVGGAYDQATNVALGFAATPAFGWVNSRTSFHANPARGARKFILPESIRREFLRRGMFGRMDSFAKPQ
jgi:probable HAF family extracellular repeat protein